MLDQMTPYDFRERMAFAMLQDEEIEKQVGGEKPKMTAEQVDAQLGQFAKLAGM